eukprot:749549-Pyramimonas_sp.AAC.1
MCIRDSSNPVRTTAELLVNPTLIRGTLSVEVRNILARGEMPYLRLGEDKRSGSNWDKLDDLIVSCDGK